MMVDDVMLCGLKKVSYAETYPAYEAALTCHSKIVRLLPLTACLSANTLNSSNF